MNYESIYRFLFNQRRRFLQLTDHDFEDLVHDAMVKIIDKSDSYKGDYPVNLWANYILRNTYIDKLRKISYTKNGTTQFYYFKNIQQTRLPESETIYDEMELKHFRSFISNIKNPTVRKIFQLRCAGYKLREISDILNLNISNVKSSISREIPKLRAQLNNQILINF